MFKGQIATGTVEGTGAEITIETGFSPSYVRVANFDDPTSMEWWSGMGDAAGLKLSDSPAYTKSTSNGITAYAGAEGATPAGFKIGVDTDLNVSGQTLYWIALGDT